MIALKLRLTGIIQAEARAAFGPEVYRPSFMLLFREVDNWNYLVFVAQTLAASEE